MSKKFKIACIQTEPKPDYETALSEIFSLSRFSSILAANFGVFSMNVTDLAPLEIASMPSAPDPEKQSAHLRSSISKFNQLKRISLNLFDVGLSLEEEGKEI